MKKPRKEAKDKTLQKKKTAVKLELQGRAKYTLSYLKNAKAKGQTPKATKKLDSTFSGLSQLTKGKGFSLNKPIEEIGLGFYDLMELLELTVVSQAVFKKDKFLVDQMKVKSGKWKFNLYNLVDPRQKEEKFAVLG